VRAFIEGFDGKVVTISNIYFPIIEETIAKETGLPIDGERWFKSQTIIGIDIESFLKDEYRGEIQRHGIQRSWLNPSWNENMKVIQIFFTCKGRYNGICMYHFKFLAHLEGQVRMSMPYFLLKNLTKMLSKVQAKKKTAPHCIFHIGLIRMIIFIYLRKL
jgi:hypothetical protein